MKRPYSVSIVSQLVQGAETKIECNVVFVEADSPGEARARGLAKVYNAFSIHQDWDHRGYVAEVPQELIDKYATYQPMVWAVS